MILWVYDRWGHQVNCLGDLVNPAFDDELGALDYLEFDIIDDVLKKGDYLVWRDEFGKWHEHIVRSVTRTHGNGVVTCSIYAINSVSELNLSYVNERNSYGFSNFEALRRLLESTRWTTGTVDSLGSGDIKFYHENVYTGIVEVVEKWGGEISTTITVGTKGVTSRKLNHQKTRGEDNGLLFTYGFDANNIVRSVESDDVYTRLHVFGKGEANYNEASSDPKYSRRITFADINGGNDYVEDDDAKEQWGIIAKDGTYNHSEGVYFADSCEDPTELLAIGKAKLEELKHPRITYSANVAILSDAGMEFKNAQTGDMCYIRDKELNERLSGRILHVKRYLSGDKPTDITLGNLKRTVRQTFDEYGKKLDSLSSSATKWNGIVSADPGWLNNMMSNLNDVMNAVGGYAYWEQGEGITVYDKPIDQNPTMAIQLAGAGFRIANSKKSDGRWNWRTFGTGDGFTADVINAGIIQGGKSYWNLETGELLIDGTFQTGSDGDRVVISPDFTYTDAAGNEETGSGIRFPLDREMSYEPYVFAANSPYPGITIFGGRISDDKPYSYISTAINEDFQSEAVTALQLVSLAERAVKCKSAEIRFNARKSAALVDIFVTNDNGTTVSGATFNSAGWAELEGYYHSSNGYSTVYFGTSRGGHLSANGNVSFSYTYRYPAAVGIYLPNVTPYSYGGVVINVVSEYASSMYVNVKNIGNVEVDYGFDFHAFLYNQ